MEMEKKTIIFYLIYFFFLNLDRRKEIKNLGNVLRDIEILITIFFSFYYFFFKIQRKKVSLIFHLNRPLLQRSLL